MSEPTPEQVLVIQREECLRLARALKSEFAWAEVKRRQSQIEALRLQNSEK